MDRIQEQLEKQVEVERVEFAEDNLDALQACLDRVEAGDGYDAVLDINSKLPYLVLEDGTRFLDALQAPFYNYILDHPLYHHPGLVFPLKDAHAIAIDRAHQTYMETYYPQLKSVEYLPLGGTSALGKCTREAFHEQYRKRNIPLLFTGTYLNREMVNLELHGRGQVNQAQEQEWYDTHIWPLSQQILQQWKVEQEPLEDVVRRILEPISEAFPEIMNRLYAVDRFVRNEIRTDILVAIAKSGLKMTVLGEGWEQTELATYDNVTLLPGCEIQDSFRYMANSYMVLDINPLFHQGLHDRVTSALANGAVCITNMNPAAAPAFPRKGAGGKAGVKEETDCPMVFYQASQVQDMIQRIADMDLDEMETLAWRGYCCWEEQLQWEQVARKFLDFLHRES